MDKDCQDKSFKNNVNPTVKLQWEAPLILLTIEKG